MTFDQDMPGTGCREYTNGGANNGGCVTGSLLPKSVFARAGRCVFFSQPGCQGGYSDSNGPISDCTDASRTEWANIRSFWCAGCECSRRLAVLLLVSCQLTWLRRNTISVRGQGIPRVKGTAALDVFPAPGTFRCLDNESSRTQGVLPLR
jgi:hypothetical protein